MAVGISKRPVLDFLLKVGEQAKFSIKNNSSVPDHALEYKNEMRLSRKELIITPIDPSFEKQIFLLYPYPKTITYTDQHYNELHIGDTVEKHVVMDVRALNELLFNKN